jgi:metal-sulfur cluster biosynthetic enzyme
VDEREDGAAGLAAAVRRALDRIKDPCHLLSGHDLSIVDLGLVNRVDLVGDTVEVGLTFTDSTCLFAYKIIQELEDLAPSLPGIAAVKVVAEPFPLWDESRLSDRARALYADKRTQFGLAQVTARGRGPSAAASA